MLVDILRNSKKPIYVKIILIWLSCFTNYASKQPIYFLKSLNDVKKYTYCSQYVVGKKFVKSAKRYKDVSLIL